MYLMEYTGCLPKAGFPSDLKSAWLNPPTTSADSLLQPGSLDAFSVLSATWSHCLSFPASWSAALLRFFLKDLFFVFLLAAFLFPPPLTLWPGSISLQNHSRMSSIKICKACLRGCGFPFSKDLSVEIKMMTVTLETEVPQKFNAHLITSRPWQLPPNFILEFMYSQIKTGKLV